MNAGSTPPSVGCFASFAAGASRFGSRLSAGARTCGTALADRLARLCSSSARVANSHGQSSDLVGTTARGQPGGSLPALPLPLSLPLPIVDAEPHDSKYTNCPPGLGPGRAFPSALADPLGPPDRHARPPRPRGRGGRLDSGHARSPVPAGRERLPTRKQLRRMRIRISQTGECVFITN